MLLVLIVVLLCSHKVLALMDANGMGGPSDAVVRELNRTTVSSIANSAFGFEYNSATSTPPRFPIEGATWEDMDGSWLVDVTLQSKQNMIRSIAVVDTKSPFVSLNEETLQALGVKDEASILVHGRHTYVRRSTAPFADLNVLGLPYFSKNRLTVIMDYNLLQVEIRLPPSEDMLQGVKWRPDE